jgi:ApaG protein
MIYHAQTGELTVKVMPEFQDHQSDPDAQHFVWSYHVRIENAGEVTVQLHRRRWEITDAFGNIKRVVGDGVVGAQPVLSQNEFFEYDSGVFLNTPSGFMRGFYEMEDEDGNEFDIAIPAFALESPYQTVVVQ